MSLREPDNIRSLPDTERKPEFVAEVSLKMQSLQVEIIKFFLYRNLALKWRSSDFLREIICCEETLGRF